MLGLTALGAAHGLASASWTAPNYTQCGSAPPTGDWAVGQIPVQKQFSDSWIPAIENRTRDQV
eukprot:gene1264-6595_t